MVAHSSEEDSPSQEEQVYPWQWIGSCCQHEAGKAKVGAQLAFSFVSFFIQSGTLVHGMVLSICKRALPPQVNCLGNILTHPLRWYLISTVGVSFVFVWG